MGGRHNKSALFEARRIFLRMRIEMALIKSQTVAQGVYVSEPTRR